MTANEPRSVLVRTAALAMLLLFAGFVVRESLVGGCAVDRVVPSGHGPAPAQSLP